MENQTIDEIIAEANALSEQQELIKGIYDSGYGIPMIMNEAGEVVPRDKEQFLADYENRRNEALELIASM